MNKHSIVRYSFGTSLYFGIVGIVCTFYYPFLQQQMGLDLISISRITSFGALFSLASQPLLGWLFTKVPNKKLFMSAYLLAIFLLIVLLLRRDKSMIYLLAGIYGCIAIPMIGTYEIYIETISQECGYSYAKVRKWGSVGMGTITLAGGSIIALFTFQGLYITGIFLLIICGFLFYLFFYNPVMSSKKEKRVSFHKILVDRKVNILYLLCFFGLGSYIGCDFAFSPYLTEICKNTEQANQIFSFSTGIKIIMEFVMFIIIGRYVMNLCAKKVLIIVFSLISIRFMMISTGVIGLVVIGDMLHCLIFPLFLSYIFSYLRSLVDSDLVAGCYSILSVLIFGVSNLIYPMIFSAVMNAWGYQVMYLTVAIIAGGACCMGRLILPKPIA